MSTYFVRFPVRDEDARLSELQREGLDALARQLEVANLVAMSNPVWSVESVDLPEGGEVLELHAAVEVRDLGTHYGLSLPRVRRKNARERAMA